MRALLVEVQARLGHFGRMRDEQMGDGRTPDQQDESWHRLAQYLQGRVESLQDVEKMILARLGAGVHTPDGSRNS